MNYKKYIKSYSAQIEISNIENSIFDSEFNQKNSKKLVPIRKSESCSQYV